MRDGHLKLVALALLCLLPGVGRAAGAVEEAPEVSPEVRRVLSKVDEANRELEDMTARVRYKRSIPLLEEKKKSRGRLTFRKPDMIRLTLGRPRNQDVYTDGETWWVVDHDRRQVEVYEAAGGEDPEAAFLQFGYGKGSEALLEDYHVELVEKQTQETDEEEWVRYRLRFTPREQTDPPPRYVRIEVTVSGERWLPHELVLQESGGKIIHTYRLSDIELNQGVEESVFRYAPPKDYNVVRPGQS